MATNLDFLGIVQCPNGPFIICYSCGHVVGARGALSAHLNKTHKIVPSQAKILVAARPDIAQLVPKTFGCIPAPWPNDIMPAPGLKLFQGWECSLCEYKCLSQDHAKRHVRKGHPDSSQTAYRINYLRPVVLQTWFQTSAGGWGVWWRVSQTGPAPPIYPGLLAWNCDVGLRERHRQFALTRPYSQVLPPAQSPAPPEIPTSTRPIPENPLAETNLVGTQRKDDAELYVQHADWPRTFAGFSYFQAIRQLTYLPHTQEGVALSLELLHLDRTLLQYAYRFTSSQESILYLIVQEMPGVWDRCYTTFCTTPRIIRTWIVSYDNSKRVFDWPRNRNTVQAYTRTWTRLLCILFRAGQLRAQGIEAQLVNIWRRISPEIQAQIQTIWELAGELYQAQTEFYDTCDTESNSVETDLQEEHTAKLAKLQELLVKLSVSLVTQNLSDWKPITTNVLLYFTGRFLRSWYSF